MTADTDARVSRLWTGPIHIEALLPWGIEMKLERSWRLMRRWSPNANRRTSAEKLGGLNE
ncbi:MAG TPA: hypothetical protein VK747_15680 [Blastocatellia bacterium]|nr:hypothetical protein [Blastocatellia bacterium]